jgi:DNA-binding NtrC family response regulator
MEKSMLSILLVGKDPHMLATFAAELARKENITVRRAASGKEAWRILGQERVQVVVTDEQLADSAALPFVVELTRRYPLVNCAMVSPLAAKDFHEATEGLGVFMQLPVNPGAVEVAEMLRILESIDALMAM